MTYIEAIKYLGEKYGVEINESTSGYEKNNDKESLLILLNKSKDFFLENLKTDEGKNIALTYLIIGKYQLR